MRLTHNALALHRSARLAAASNLGLQMVTLFLSGPLAAGTRFGGPIPACLQPVQEGDNRADEANHQDHDHAPHGRSPFVNATAITISADQAVNPTNAYFENRSSTGSDQPGRAGSAPAFSPRREIVGRSGSLPR